VPTTNALLNKSKIPLGLILSPYRTVREADGDEPVPVVSDTVIARCRRCRTYINPYVQFIEGGNRWKCCMCNISNEVPQLFDWDQEKNQPADRWQRPELNHSVVEFIAPREYMVSGKRGICGAGRVADAPTRRSGRRSRQCTSSSSTSRTRPSAAAWSPRPRARFSRRSTACPTTTTGQKSASSPSTRPCTSSACL